MKYLYIFSILVFMSCSVKLSMKLVFITSRHVIYLFVIFSLQIFELRTDIPNPAYKGPENTAAPQKNTIPKSIGPRPVDMELC